MSQVSKELTNQLYDEITNSPPMTGADLKAWLEEVGLTQKQAAEMMGRGPRQLRIYVKEAEKAVPRYIQLSCAFIKMRLEMKKRLHSA